MLDALRQPRRWGLPFGAALLAGAVAMIGAGAYAALAGGTYVGLGAHGRYGTSRYALITDSTNWRTEFLGWAGSVRLQVVSQREKPIFVGVAAPDAISPHLSGSGYTTVAEHTGRGIVRSDHDGAAPAVLRPGTVDWTAHAEGLGTQTLRWNAAGGRQVVFAMNADGSRPVRVRVVSSAVTLGRMPAWVPAGLLAFGFVLLSTGLVVIRRAIRARRAT
jgi:hypothetical protein